MASSFFWTGCDQIPMEVTSSLTYATVNVQGRTKQMAKETTCFIFCTHRGSSIQGRNRSSLSFTFNYGPERKKKDCNSRRLQRNVFHCLSLSLSLCVCVEKEEKWTCKVDLRQSTDRAVALTYFCCVQNRSHGGVNVLFQFGCFIFSFHSSRRRQSHVFSFFIISFFLNIFLSILFLLADNKITKKPIVCFFII